MNTGSPIPFATIAVVGKSTGAITDFEGNYRLQVEVSDDSLQARSIGYVSRNKPINLSEPIINFQLEEDVKTLSEVVVYAGENPAHPIMREVIKNKPRNDKRSLEAFEYEAYTKIELDVDNMSDRLRDRRVVRSITNVLDSIDQIAGEDGKPILPVFISETISRFYFRNNPVFKHEDILHTKITGVGLTDGTTTAQIVGSTLQEYNFYRNWLNIMSKAFASPISDGWKLYYDYDLVDSLWLDDDYVYRLDFYPSNDQDPLFQGTMWITSDDFAIKQIDATVRKSVNLNYIEKIKIQQNLKRTSTGAWIPHKSRVIVDISQLSKNSAGLLAKFYISTKDVTVNKPRESEFYLNPVSLKPDARKDDETFWEEYRHDPLTSTEASVYQMIDTLKKIPFVKAGVDAAKFGFTGFYTTGPIDLGPYTVFYGDNNIEGLRLGVGGRTNFQFSKKVTLGGYVAYGFQDERIKYQSYVNVVLDRNHWTTLHLERQEELDQIWLLGDDVSTRSFLFTFSRFGNLTLPFLFTRNKVELERQLIRGISQTFGVQHQRFTPQYDFRFSTSRQEPGEFLQQFEVAELRLSTKWGKDELFVVNDNERWSLGSVLWPIVVLDYSFGVPGLLGSDLYYHKLQMTLSQRQPLGPLGVSRIQIRAGQVFGEVPYPLLFNLIGNETPFYASFTYNLMNFFEFSADRFISVRYRHSFEGLIFNKIPLIRKLKWRAVGNANLVYGDISDQNINLVDYPLNREGMPRIPFQSFDGIPYVELGYGIENIFKVFRIDAFHRLTYLDNPDVNNFGVKFSAQLIF